MADPQSTFLIAAGTRGGGGLYGLCQRQAGDLTVGSVYPDATEVSFSDYSARHDLHYFVDEGAGNVGAHRHHEGRWEMLAAIPSGGAAPCHIALNHTETLLAVANYASGSTSLFRLNAHDGLPLGNVSVHANRGSGSNLQRQERPHAHWVGFTADGRWLFQTDLGTDEILAFAIDSGCELQAPRRAYRAPPGSGPRHLLLHPKLAGKAYLASELASTLTLLDFADGEFYNPLIMSTLPFGWQGDNIVAHIAMNRKGTRLYVSNRGHDSIAVFAIGENGVPTLLQHVWAGGAFPRFFLLIEEQALMLVANEKDQTIARLVIECDGRLTPTGAALSIPGVCYLLICNPEFGGARVNS